jgi:hypothetical protein
MGIEVDFQLMHQLVDFLQTELLGWCYNFHTTIAWPDE